VFGDYELLNLVVAEREFWCVPVTERRNVATDGARLDRDVVRVRAVGLFERSR
jgi:hypothetical protein